MGFTLRNMLNIIAVIAVIYIFTRSSSLVGAVGSIEISDLVVNFKSPTENQVLVIPIDQSTVSAQFEFSIGFESTNSLLEENDYDDITACVTVLKKLGDKFIHLGSGCYSPRMPYIVMSGSDPADYILEGTVTKGSESGEKKTIRNFKIVKLSNNLPKLAYAIENPTFILPAGHDRGHVQLPYSLESAVIPQEEFVICASVKVDNEVVVNRQCMNIGNEFAMYNMLPGVYAVTIDAGLRIAANEIIPDTSIETKIHVVRFESNLPLIIPPQDDFEAGIEDSGRTTGKVSFALQGIESSITQSHVCVSIYPDNDPTNVLKHLRLPPQQMSFDLFDIAEGDYIVAFSICTVSGTDVTSYPQSAIRHKLVARRMQEFEPSYDWQHLHAWHTIPAGVETRLPLGPEGHKEVRIPDPWRLQLLMPSPCKYFLRVDVFRSTDFSDIRSEASKKCHIPAECFQIDIDGIIYVTGATNTLFNKKAKLLVDSVDAQCREINA